MRRLLCMSLWVGLLTSMAAGCAMVDERADDLRSAARELRGDLADLSDDSRFCLALTRAATAIESGSPATAEDATEEALAHAPDEVVTETREVAETVRRARDEGGWNPDDPDLTAAVTKLGETARQHCPSG